MIQRRVYKYPLNPTRLQRVEIDDILDKCREFYNSVIDLDIEYRNHNSFLMTYNYAAKEIKGVKDAFDCYDKIHSHLIQSTLDRYFIARDKTFKNYQERLKYESYLDKIKISKPKQYPGALERYQKKFKNKAAGPFPRHKSVERFNTVLFKQENNGYRFKSDSKIRFNQMTLSYKKTRDYEGKIKFVGISRKLDKYYLLVYTEAEKYTVETSKNTLNNYKDIKVKAKKKDKTDTIGVDIGIKEFLVCSDGTIYHNPKLINKYQDKIKDSRSRLSQKVEGSNRYKKQQKLHAKHEAKLANVREDFLHKVSKDLINNYDTIILEDLNMVELMHKNYKNVNRHLSNIASAKLTQFLCYKAENAGKTVLLVDPSNTSKMCSKCGNIADKELSDRTHKCNLCGLELDRDFNASINILNKGLKARNGPAD